MPVLAILLMLGLAVSMARAGVASAAEPVFPHFSGAEFAALFNDATLEHVSPAGTLPPVTGNAATDARIRTLAERRGYTRRPMALSPLAEVDGYLLQPPAAAAWRELVAAAARQSYALVLESGYRDEFTQAVVFTQGLDGYGDVQIDARLQFSAPPGYSKHHTGYAIDVGQHGKFVFATSPAYRWMAADNFDVAKRFGFVPSYPTGSPPQGPIPEPWEFVYVGVEAISCGPGGCKCNGRAPESTTSVPASSTSAMTVVTPVRIADTRVAMPDRVAAKVCAGRSLRLVVAGRAGVPSDATAVALQVTLTETSGAGFVSAVPAGVRPGATSVLNATGSGQTVANFVIVEVGVGGAVDLFTQAGAHVVVDLAGYFRASNAASAGRIEARSPVRALDTRVAPATRAADSTLTLPLAGGFGIPATATAVVINLTGVDSAAAGYVTAFPSGSPRPTASSLNAIPGRAVANFAIVALGPDGSISLYAHPRLHLVVDVVGWVSGPNSGATTRGLFVPSAIGRLLDTRQSGARPGPAATVTTGSFSAAIDAPVSGVFGNLTVTDAAAAGYLTAYPVVDARPLASSVNAGSRNDTRANSLLAAVGDGRLGIFTQSGGHVVVDVFGYLAA